MIWRPIWEPMACAALRANLPNMSDAGDSALRRLDGSRGALGSRVPPDDPGGRGTLMSMFSSAVRAACSSTRFLMIS